MWEWTDYSTESSGPVPGLLLSDGDNPAIVVQEELGFGSKLLFRDPSLGAVIAPNCVDPGAVLELPIENGERGTRRNRGSRRRSLRVLHQGHFIAWCGWARQESHLLSFTEEGQR